MTDSHTELCERLRSHDAMVLRGLDSLMKTCVEAAALIEQQAARIADLENERDALREDARQFYNLTQGDVTVIIRAPSAEKRNAIITAANRLRAALQAEKETRS